MIDKSVELGESTVSKVVTLLALAEPAVHAAARAPRGELVRMPGGHYEPFLTGHEHAVDAEVSFLHRHLLGREE